MKTIKVVKYPGVHYFEIQRGKQYKTIKVGHKGLKDLVLIDVDKNGRALGIEIIVFRTKTKAK